MKKKDIKLGDWVSYEYGEHDEHLGIGSVHAILGDELHLNGGARIPIWRVIEVRRPK